MTPTPRLRGRKAVEVRARRMARTHGYCEMCEGKGLYGVKATVVDHAIPLAKGGSDDDGNTRNLCAECHRRVTAEQFGTRYRPAISADGWPIA